MKKQRTYEFAVVVRIARTWRTLKVSPTRKEAIAYRHLYSILEKRLGRRQTRIVARPLPVTEGGAT